MLADDELQQVIFAELRRCPHSWLDSVVAEKIATAILVAEARASPENTAPVGGKGRKRCLWCSSLFWFGPGTGKRRTAMYCNPSCQGAHAYEKKKGKGAGSPPAN